MKNTKLLKIQAQKLKIHSHNFILAAVIIAMAFLMRIAPHFPNMTPVAAIALFGGIYLNKHFAFILPLLSLFLSDFFILGFHDTTIFVYGSFLLTGVMGRALRYHREWYFLLAGTLISSIFFFLITNFGVWLVSGMYDKTFSGLLQSYYMALPFFRNSLLGDIMYMGLLVGCYKLVPNYKMRTLSIGHLFNAPVI